jgi:hypothetical protein
MSEFSGPRTDQGRSDALLTKVRKLLVKAEAPAVAPAEPEAYSVKAAELIATYDIDRTLPTVDPATTWSATGLSSSTPRMRGTKANLLHGIATTLRCRTVVKVAVGERPQGIVPASVRIRLRPGASRAAAVGSMRRRSAAPGSLASPPPWCATGGGRAALREHAAQHRAGRRQATPIGGAEARRPLGHGGEGGGRCVPAFAYRRSPQAVRLRPPRGVDRGPARAPGHVAARRPGATDR